MRSKVLVALTALCCFPFATDAAEVPQDQNLLFGAVVDDNCDESTFRVESAALAAWAAKFAVNAVVGFGSSLLDKANEATSIVRTGTAPGYFYRWSGTKKAWLPEGACVRFWYGRQRSVALKDASQADYGSGPVGSELAWKAITARWAALGLVEQPYLYGEVRLASREVDNLVVLQPVVLFARRPPEAQGFLRKPTRLAIGIDLKALGADSNLASQLLEMPEVAASPVLIRGASATRGLASGFAALPAPPTEPSKGAKDVEAGPFTAMVTFTSASDGTLFGKALAGSFKKDELSAALAPQSKAQKAEDQHKAISEAFDAVALVLDAQAALDKAADGEKPRLTLALQKAQYLANVRLQAAGLPPRYAVSGP